VEQPPHVLVIEDDADVLDLLDGHLTRLGCRVSRAISGEQGVSAAVAERPDVIFVDMVLPGINGREVADRLRGDRRTATCKIVVTSVLDPQDLDDTRFDGILTKPFRRADIRTALSTVDVAIPEVSP
jgi:two-component system response regulator RpaA